MLVTGAGGFIGSHTAERLAGAGATVRAFVRYNSRNDYGWLETLDASLLDHTEIFRGDLTNPEAVRDAVENCEIVVHLGALIPIPYSYRHPREFVAANVVGTLNVLEACRRGGVRRLVHTSTSEVYGTAQRVPIAEDHPLVAQSPYAATKIGADQLALTYHRAYELPVVVARPFNTYGPRQSARAVIPTIVSQALTRDRVELGSLHPTRDFVYVSDTVDGILACAAAGGEVNGEVINLGTGTEVSIGEVAEQIIQLLGRDVALVTTDERRRPEASEVERLLASAEKAQALLGWTASTSFAQGLSSTIDWIRPRSQTVYKPDVYNL